jgi:prepilin-type N-terminal cleavage/methylation domain-containing protein
VATTTLDSGDGVRQRQPFSEFASIASLIGRLSKALRELTGFIGVVMLAQARERARKAKGWQRGFTLIEMMVVMAIISILLTVALPIYQKSLIRAKESVLRNNLFTIRSMSRSRRKGNTRTEKYRHL